MRRMPLLRLFIQSPGKTTRSLRSRLLKALVVPLLVLLVLDGLLTYGGALVYSNYVHDRGLVDDVLTLKQLVATQAPSGSISPQASFLLRYDPSGRDYYSIRTSQGQLLAGDKRLMPPTLSVTTAGRPLLYYTMTDHRQLRAASIALPDIAHAGRGTLLISVADPLHDRRLVARQILLLSVPAQAVLILAVLGLIWFGVRVGLRGLDPLTKRLATPEHDLTAIEVANVPLEIKPLANTINNLFARVRGILVLQDQFIADAAHQLRTPIAGLRIHAERAMTINDQSTTHDALSHMLPLIDRISRTSTQLLVLSRAQIPKRDPAMPIRLDLATVVPQLVSQRVQEALSMGVDLGYEGPPGKLWIDGDASSLQELIDNLIDNSLHYAGRGSTITITLSRRTDRASLAVDDDGPGISSEWLRHLGERFFRVPGSDTTGTGLGLAIVRRIAENHGAQVLFTPSALGGLRVEVIFPHARHES